MSVSFRTPVLVIGAGPGGAATALQLHKLGQSCIVIDKAVFPRDKICGDAISGKVVSALNKINPALVDELMHNRDNVLPSWGVTFVAPNLKQLKVPFKSNYKVESDAPPGCLSKRIDFDNFLVNKIKETDGIQLIEGCEARDYQYQNGRWTVNCSDGRVIETPLIIAANGAQSSFSKNIAHIDMESGHYCAGLRVYYKNVEGLDADNFIELHFLKEFLPGYLWIFPLPGGYANVGVGMRSDKVSNKKVNLRKKLEEIIKEHPAISKRFKNAIPVESIKGYGLPLGSKKRTLSGQGYMLVGDAASLIDPFTGEGIGNAMLSGLMAANKAIEGVKENRFDAAFLKGYDTNVYSALWSELMLGYRMQQLVSYPWLFNLVVNKALKSATLRNTLISMFENIDLRKRLKKPGFYVRLLFNK